MPTELTGQTTMSALSCKMSPCTTLKPGRLLKTVIIALVIILAHSPWVDPRSCRKGLRFGSRFHDGDADRRITCLDPVVDHHIGEHLKVLCR